MQIQRLAIAVAALAVPLVAVPAGPAQAAATRKVDCKKLKGKDLVKAILEGRCRSGRSGRGTGAPVGSVPVKVQVQGKQVTSWSEQGLSRSSVGTASECHGSSSGGGQQVVSFHTTRPQTGFVARRDRRRLALETSVPLGGDVSREGARRSSSSGPGCAPSENIWDASGCGERDLTPAGYAATVSYDGGRLRLDLSDFGRASGQIVPCPFSELTKYGGEFAEVPARSVAAATLLRGRSVVLRGSVTVPEQTDCAEENGGAPCATPPDSMDYTETATTRLDWTLKISR